MFSLATPIERQAALAALTAYIEVLDGVRIQPVDNPTCGALPAQVEAPPILAAGGISTTRITSLVGEVPSEQVVPMPPAAEVFGVVTTPPTPFPYPTVEQTLASQPIILTVPTVPGAPAADTDVNGVAWNADTHSSSKAKNRDGTWRVKRNTGTKDDVPPAPPVVDTTPPAPPVVAVTPPAPPVAVVTPAAPPVAGQGPTTFKELMTALNPLMSGGKIDFQSVASACQMNGVAALPALNANPSAIPAVWATIQGML